MGIEIERKFLVINDLWRNQIKTQSFYSQGYLTQGGAQASVRVRLAGDKAWINIKSVTLEVSRTEFEYRIPVDEAKEMLEQLCIQPLITKTRYTVPCGQHVWEIDVFEGANQGLLVAEIELQAEDEQFIKPQWLGAEVSSDPRYYNTNLVSHPYQSWPEQAS